MESHDVGAEKLNFAKIILETATRFPDKPALVFDDNTYTYNEISYFVKNYANLLARLGVKKGDRVAIQLVKCVEFIFLHLANLRLGAITLPLNTAYPTEEVFYYLNDSGSNLFVTDRESPKQVISENNQTRIILKGSNPSEGDLDSLLKESEKHGTEHLPDNPTHADDVALMCYTSGTTGKPKGAMITHRNLVTNTMALHKTWMWTEQDVLLHVLPLFHIHGLCVALHGGLNACSTVVIHEKFEPRKTLDTIKEKRCTMFMAVPTIYYRLMEAWSELEPDLSSMRVFISGSAPLSAQLFDHFKSTTGFSILERYGMTETQMITSNPYEPEKRIPKSAGYPLPGVEIRLVHDTGVDVKPGEIGEVLVKGENVFKGYWRMPRKTEDSFMGEWFRTGDLGYQDENDEMRLYLVGRSKEMINSGGYNIYPKEVEDVLNQHKSVKESAVVGISDREFGERAAAAVVLKEDQPLVLEEDLIGFCKERLASYKCPKQITFLEKLPRNAMGKIQKYLIRF